MSTPDSSNAVPAPSAAPVAGAGRSATPPAAGAAPAVRAVGKVWAIRMVAVLLVLAAGIFWLSRSWNTVSTDDAYVNGHVTFVASRVPGQVARVLVEDNNRVHKGDLLLELDKEPYQAQVNIAHAALAAAQADLVLTQAQVRGEEGEVRSLRYKLEHAMEDVNDQVTVLRSRVATLQSKKDTLSKAQAEYERAKPLIASQYMSAEEFDRRHEAFLVAQAQVEEALQGVYQIRAALGLPRTPETGDDLAQAPDDWNQSAASVKQAQASLQQAAAALGVTHSFTQSPKDMLADFYKLDPAGNVDRIFAQLLKDAPAVKQAEAKIAQAQSNLDQANLNLRYCDVVAEIDGVVTRRSVNPGNNVVAGQSLMAVRSLTEIWVDANFKETQLAKLRIGQAVDLEVDMYGRRQKFKGRISGFTMGTGSTLALLQSENATGNFVKVVQRLPVRIELVDYDPDKTPLFTGLSVTPVVRLSEPLSGPYAGAVLQPYVPPSTTPPTVAP